STGPEALHAARWFPSKLITSRNTAVAVTSPPGTPDATSPTPVRDVLRALSAPPPPTLVASDEKRTPPTACPGSDCGYNTPRLHRRDACKTASIADRTLGLSLFQDARSARSIANVGESGAASSASDASACARASVAVRSTAR